MTTISFKLPEEDKEFLDWLAEREASPIGSLYRQATLEHFHQWKISVVLQKYQSGEIGFKEMCTRAGITLNQGMLLLEEREIDPPISELLDEITFRNTMNNIEAADPDILRTGTLKRNK